MNYDKDGMQKAQNIIRDIRSKDIDFVDEAQKIFDQKNLILDRTGMLAVKAKEGLDEIAILIMSLGTKRNSLINLVNAEGTTLYSNYKKYQKQMELRNINNEVKVSRTSSNKKEMFY